MYNNLMRVTRKYRKKRIYHDLLDCSENSYDPVVTNQEALHNIIFLNFNLNWLYLVNVANFLLLSYYTYVLVFYIDIPFSIQLCMAEMICLFIVAVDIVSMILHKCNKKIASTRPIEPVKLGFILIDVFSIPSMVIPATSFYLAEYYHYVRIGFACLRCYRLFKYFYISTISATEFTAISMFRIYGLICGFIVHIATCILQSICTDCKFGIRKQNNWYGELGMQIYFNASKEATPLHIYFVGVYSILGIFTRVGYSGAAPRNIVENIFVSSLSLLAMFIISGCFLSSFIYVRIANQRMQHEFFSKLIIIKNNLERDRISLVLKNVILDYYNFLWEKEKGIKQSSLFKSLPDSVQHQVTLDKYWQALEQSYIMRNETEEFRREVSSYMYTEIMIKGETIYKLGEKKNAMAYIAKGSVQLLSRHDGESPILTLGAGSLLGEISLLCSYRCNVMVRAECYCVIYYLDKRDFWKLRSIRCNRERSQSVHNKWNKKLRDSKQNLEQLKNYDKQFCFLANVKKKLVTEKDMRATNDSGTVEKLFKRFRTNDSYSSLYTLRSKMENVLNYDDVFARTTWPWILHPRSQAIVIWDTCLLILVITNAIILPYTLIIGEEDDAVGRLMKMLLPVTSFFYILDVVLMLFIGVETGDVLHTQVSKIIGYRIADFVFLLDVVAALPFYLFTENYWNINMLMKVGQVVKFVVKVEKSLVINVFIVKTVKYMIFIMYTTYFFAVLFILISCVSITKEACLHQSWIKLLDLTKWTPQSILIMCMAHVLSVLSQTDGQFNTSLTDMVLTAIIAVLGVVLFIYIFSEFTASMVSNAKLKQWYIELVYNIEKYMQANNIAKEIRLRMRSFLESQWLIDKGLKKHELYRDLPDDLYRELQIDKFLSFCSTLPLFQDIDTNLLQSLVQYCKPLFLPPNELIVHEGDYANHIFIIEKGYCEILCVEKDRVVIGTPAIFGEIEMILNKPRQHAVRTVTHVSLISISRKRFLEFLNAYPDVKTHLTNVINDLKDSILVHRVFNDTSSIESLFLEQKKTKSWFKFPKQKRDPLAKDFERPFTEMGSFKILRLILFRRSFIPDGNFIIRWEVFRAILAIFSAFMGPSFLVLLSVSKHAFTMCYCFDTIYVLDIYLRLHGAYYNDKGLLVTHPLKTAQRYMTSGFLVDFISTLPYASLMFSNDNLKLICIMHFGKLLQLYRLPGALFIIKKNWFRQNTLLENCLLLIPLLIMVINTTACTNMILSYKFLLDNDGYLCLTREGATSRDNRTLLRKYYIALFRITTHTFTLGFTRTRAYNIDIFLLFASCILIGYLILSYALMVLINHQANISFHLTGIQNNTKSLVKYMKRENIPAQLQKDTLQYFEIFWRRSNHMIQAEVLKRCHSGLTQDWILHMYGETLSKVPVFYEMGNTFYKMIGSHMQTAHFLGDATILKLNDIVDTVYIVHQGFVRVVGSDGSVSEHLAQGSMFGNIDEVPKSRSMITINATKPIDLIFIDTAAMYNLLKSYPVVINRINKHLLIKCLAYISADNSKTDESETCDLSKLHASDILAIEYKTWNIDIIYTIMTSSYTRAFFMMCSYATAIIVLALLAFNIDRLVVYLYTVDGLILLKIILTLFTPYVNHVGEIVKEKKLIWKRYIKSADFIFDIIGVVPIELFGYCISNDPHYYIHRLRMLRLCRLFAVYQYFSKAYANLDVNMLCVKLTTVLLYTFLLVHCAACIVYFFSCGSEENCPEKSWMQYDEYGEYDWKFIDFYGYRGTISGCLNSGYYYTCSVLYAVSLITMTGYPFPRPIEIIHRDTLVACVILVLCRIIIATVMGHLFGLLRHLSYEVMTHNYATIELKKFLRQSAISPYLTKRIMKYVNHLWMLEKAVQLPTLLAEAPPYLSEQIKIAAYGHHLDQNLIFQDCHPDFLRQLVRELNVENYFDGDLICQQGDLNETMYFIHRGAVDVIRTDNNVETVVDMLTELDTFGVYQGLYPCIPHTHSYQSKSVTVILKLTRDISECHSRNL